VWRDPVIAQAIFHRDSPGSNTSQIISDLCGKIGAEARFLGVFRFPLQIPIPPAVPYSLVILSSLLYRFHGDSR
jgi:hypothetical protein